MKATDCGERANRVTGRLGPRALLLTGPAILSTVAVLIVAQGREGFTGLTIEM
jgi:hypothetical protein